MERYLSSAPIKEYVMVEIQVLLIFQVGPI